MLTCGGFEPQPQAIFVIGFCGSCTRSTLPTRKMYDSAPIKVTHAMKVSAGAKLPPFTKNPITIGIMIEAVPPMKLNTPPVIPINRFGANSETNTQVIEVKPLPKKQ
jgi:hypothetical protein